MLTTPAYTGKQAYWESEHASAEKAHSKKQDECLKRWKKLVAGLAIRRRLHSDYKPQAEQPTNSGQRDIAAASFVDHSQFGDVQDNEVELKAKASIAASEHQNSKPTSLRLVHNAPPPPINTRRRTANDHTESESEQDEDTPAAAATSSIAKTEDQSSTSAPSPPPAPVRPQRQARPSSASKRKSSKRNKATISSDDSGESEPSDSDFEDVDVQSASKRPRRASRQKSQTSHNTFAANRPRRSTRVGR